MKFLQWLHRWTSLIILLQLFLWTLSAAWFTIMDHDGMKAHQYMQHGDHSMLNTTEMVDLEKFGHHFTNASLVRVQLVDGIPQVVVRYGEEEYEYLHGLTGLPWQTGEAMATRLAEASYSGPGDVKRITAIEETWELHGWKGNAWKVEFEDDLNTRVYVDETSGSVIDHRNTPWVISDWAFRLHFIDYTGGRNFNNLVIITAGVVTLWFALSGLILLIKLLGSGEMRWSWRKVPMRTQAGDSEVNLVTPKHRTILQTLQSNDLPVGSGCGGGGTCGLCKVKVEGEAMPVTDAEQELLSKEELDQGIRLACRHKTPHSGKVVLQDNATRFDMELVSSEFITPLMKELRFRIPDGSAVDYQAGQYLQFLIPGAKSRVRPDDIPESFVTSWNEIKDVTFKHSEVRRNYSMASKPGAAELVFNVRYQPPCNGAKVPGVGSTYLFGLKSGATVTAEGPFGDFVRTEPNDHVQCFIGGGAGMAPLRSLIQEELEQKQPRKIEFFYGARSRKELCYSEEFTELDNKGLLNFVQVLSEATDECSWEGFEGFVHDVVAKHLQAEDALQRDYYVCGPPAMLEATRELLKSLGVPESQIRFDDFGN